MKRPKFWFPKRRLKQRIRELSQYEAVQAKLNVMV
jgi:hypothetical protein